MEQYGNNNAGEKRSISSEDQDCFDGQRCSGYGQCSPSRGRPERKSKCDDFKIIEIFAKCILEENIQRARFSFKSL